MAAVAGGCSDVDVLFIVAKYDPVKALVASPDSLLMNRIRAITSLAKKVVCEEVESIPAFEKALSKHRANWVVICGHGRRESIAFGDASLRKDAVLNTTTVTSELFKKAHPESKFVLAACGTAEGGAGSFAHSLHSKSERPVYAATTSISLDDLIPNPYWGLDPEAEPFDFEKWTLFDQKKMVSSPKRMKDSFVKKEYSRDVKGLLLGGNFSDAGIMWVRHLVEEKKADEAFNVAQILTGEAYRLEAFYIFVEARLLDHCLRLLRATEDESIRRAVIVGLFERNLYDAVYQALRQSKNAVTVLKGIFTLFLHKRFSEGYRLWDSLPTAEWVMHLPFKLYNSGHRDLALWSMGRKLPDSGVVAFCRLLIRHSDYAGLKHVVCAPPVSAKAKAQIVGLLEELKDPKAVDLTRHLRDPVPASGGGSERYKAVLGAKQGRPATEDCAAAGGGGDVEEEDPPLKKGRISVAE